jgi:pyrimidine deaminase RibD-like protein
MECGIGKVIFAKSEPPFFVAKCTGADQLRKHGIIVEQITLLDDAIMEINRHIEISHSQKS